MNQEFYEIYGDLYARYFGEYAKDPGWRSRPPFPLSHLDAEMRALRLAVEAIEYAIFESGVWPRLRPDARHFLLVNFHQMIVLPLIRSQWFAKGSMEELRFLLRDGARQILDAAKYEESAEGEISGGAVLKSTARIWDELVLNKLEAWG